MLLNEVLENDFSNNEDFKSKTVQTEHYRFYVYYIDGMIDSNLLSRFVIEKLRFVSSMEEDTENGLVSFCDWEKTNDINKIKDGILRGKALVVCENEGYLFDVRKTEKRSVDKPSEENSIRASKDSFVEEVKINITLIRKKIVSNELKVNFSTAGKQTQTKIAVIYMKNIANEKLVQSVKRAIEKIDTDGVITPGVVQQYFSKRIFSPFPQTVTTERPDKAAHNILMGRVAVIVDGIPLCFVLPATVSEFMSTPEDYSGNFIFSSAVRLLRYFLIWVELFLPGMYVALTTFHFEMIPPKLALSIAEAREGVPFPVLFEVLSMLALFEVLVEAGLHMPESSGQAVSIVGALVVGEAAISADLVSPAALIIVAISAVCSFAMPDQEFSNGLRLWRIILTVSGGIFGLFGVIIGGIVLLCELSSLESFGVPYLAPFAGIRKTATVKAVFVIPDKNDKYRPIELNTKNKGRTK